MINRLIRFLPLVVLGAALIVLVFPVFTGQTFYWGLPTLQFHPWRQYAVQELAAGAIPWWNPFNGAGAPLLANYQSALLYPPGWLTLLLPVPIAMSLLAVGHLFLAGWGMWMFVGRLGVSPVGRAMAALAFGLTQYTLARLGTYPIVLAAAWAGWMLWAADAALTGRTLRAFAALALFSALLLLAGHAQTAWYILLLLGAFVIWRLVTDRVVTLIGLVHVAAALLLGAGMAALQLAATGELLLASQRGDGVNFDFAMNFSYAPLRSLNLVAPNLFGTPADGSYITAGAYFEDAVYIGIIPLISALSALLTLRHIRRAGSSASRRGAGLWALITIVGFVFALGRNTPIFPFFYQSVPTFDLFQAPVRWHLWTVIGLSVLGAIGAENWVRTPGIRRWSKRGLAIAGALGLAALALSVTGAGAAAALGRGLVLPAMMLGAACGLSLAIAPGMEPSRQPRWLLAVCIVIAADLMLASWGLNPTAPSDWFQPQSAAAPPDRRYLDADFVEEQTYERFFQFTDYRAAAADLAALRASGLPNINLFDRMPLLNQFDPLLIDHYARFIDLIETAEADQVRDRLLAVAGVGNHPRAWMVGAACWHPDDSSTITALTGSDQQPAGVVHLHGDGGCAATSAPVPAQIVLAHEDGDSLSLTVSAPSEGWLVLADTYYAGWRALVNGAETPIIRANLAFRAIALPEGTHSVEFVYQPSWGIPALMVTVGCWLIWALATVRALIGRRAA